MSKKRDPVVAVLNYFQSAELPLARQGLELAKEIVRRRGGGAAPGTTTKKPKRRADGSIDAGTLSAN